MASLLFASLEFVYVCVYTFQIPLARNFVSSLRLYVISRFFTSSDHSWYADCFCNSVSSKFTFSICSSATSGPASPIAISSDLPSSDSLSLNLLTHSDSSAPKLLRVLALFIYLRIVLRSTLLHHYAVRLFVIFHGISFDIVCVQRLMYESSVFGDHADVRGRWD